MEVFQLLSKSKFFSYFSVMTKVNPNKGNETKPDIFSWDIFRSDIIFIGHKTLTCFNDFYNWQLSISLQKWAQINKLSEIKFNETCANLTVFFFI